MPSDRPRLRLVRPTRSMRDRWTMFLLLLALPVIVGCAIAVWQSDVVLSAVEWTGDTFETLRDELAAQLRRIRRS
jgi:hypothetical protein